MNFLVRFDEIKLTLAYYARLMLLNNNQHALIKVFAFCTVIFWTVSWPTWNSFGTHQLKSLHKKSKGTLSIAQNLCRSFNNILMKLHHIFNPANFCCRNVIRKSLLQVQMSLHTLPYHTLATVRTKLLKILIGKKRSVKSPRPRGNIWNQAHTTWHKVKKC